MMTKVRLNSEEVIIESTGEVLGKQALNLDGRILVRDENGNEKIAIYGNVDENNNFFEFCKNVMSCGTNCFAADHPSCRYNRTMPSTGGYYVEL